jgi:ADP-heptose:LPS heptosyltransferase
LQKKYRKKLEDFNNIKIPYLFTSKDLKKVKIQNPENKIVCGVSWLSFSKEIGDEKSIPFNDIKLLFDIHNVKFLDIQYFPSKKIEEKYKTDRNSFIEKIDNVNLYEDFEVLVEVINQCNLIVTCSNTTAHIAGSLGKKTFLLIPKNKGKHWYWKSVNKRSIFYPTITVFEKTDSNDWGDTMNELKKLLLEEKY